MKCASTLTWAPFDGENGRELPERTERCYLDQGHTGYHQGSGGAFGPWIPEPDAAEREARIAYQEGRWCGECRYGVVEDPPCCTQPASTDACGHPPEHVTWKHKGPGRTVPILDGLIHGTCDLCGADVVRQASTDRRSDD